MEKQFVTKEIAVKLKELGFNEPCLAMISLDDRLRFIKNKTGYPKGSRNSECEPNILVPLWQQATDWISEKLNMELSIQFDDNCNMFYYFIHTNNKECNSNRICSLSYTNDRIFAHYYQARKEGIEKAIELIK